MNYRKSLFTLILVLIFGCSLFEDDGPKDPRDYTWTIDTLKHPDPTNAQLRLTRMWASSSDDIYIVGHSFSVYGTMWHYNGDAWSPVPIINMNGGPIENKHHGINDIFGFSKDDVWAVGRQKGKVRRNDAFIIHFDGLKWREITPPDTSQLMSVGGGNNGEIWVGPYGGGAFKYDGNKWIDGKINYTGSHGNGSYIQDFGYQQNYHPFMVYVNKENGPRNFFGIEIYKNIGMNWELIFEPTKYYYGGPWVSEEGALYLAAQKIIKIKGDATEIIGEMPSGFGVSKLYGLHEDFLFGCGRYLNGDLGNIVFYDGNEWTMLLDENIEDIFFADIWTDGKTVVAIGQIENPKDNTIIIRGE